MLPVWGGRGVPALPSVRGSNRLLFVDVEALFAPWARATAAGPHARSWLSRATPYKSGNVAKMAAVAWALDMGLDVLVADWDILCARDPLPALLRRLRARGHGTKVDIVAPVHRGVPLGFPHTTNAFTLVRATPRTKAVFAAMRDTFARTPASAAAFRAMKGTMGLFSSLIETHYKYVFAL